MPRRFDRILCWTLFTALMLALGGVLRLTVPGGLSWVRSMIGSGSLSALLMAVWLAIAWFGYGPLIRVWLAKRRGAAVREP